MGIKMSIKKLGLLFGLVGVFSGVFARDDNSSKKDNKDKKMQDCSSLCFAGPELEEDNSFNVMGAAIYGVANAQATEIALYTTSRNNTSYPEGGQGINPYENPAWGFKVGLGYRMSHDDWQLQGRYTWFKSVYNGTYDTAYGGGYFPSFYANAAIDTSSPSLTGNVTFFNNVQYGTYTLLQALNVYLFRPTLFTALLEISPYFGIDYINTTRRLVVSFTNDVAASPIYSASNGGFFRTYDKNLCWGVGPMAGVSSNWYLGYDIGIYADGYFAVTYGNARSFSQTFAYRPTVAQPNTALNSQIYNSLYQYAPHMNLQLGFNWSHTFDNERASVSFKAGYESQYFFQVNKTLANSVFYFATNGAGIGLQNLVLQLQVDF